MSINKKAKKSDKDSLLNRMEKMSVERRADHRKVKNFLAKREENLFEESHLEIKIIIVNEM